jgi:hypothetical protein
MKLVKSLPGILALALLSAASARPARAGTISFDITGTLGPVLSGIDPLKFAGQTFTASGSLDESTPPAGTTADSATYDIPGGILISLGAVTLNGFNTALTLTAPPSGPDTMFLEFSVTELSFTPDVMAILSLPEGTLNGTGLQNFSASVSQPDSSLTFVLPGVSTVITGTLGVTGTASMSGATAPPPSGVPEPATMTLLAGGLIVIGWKRRRA